jgi:hypothetical protein
MVRVAPAAAENDAEDFRLPWRAKLACKQCRNRWQLQRINLIAFQTPKRARPFTVNRQHQHHEAAAVLASRR